MLYTLVLRLNFSSDQDLPCSVTSSEEPGGSPAGIASSSASVVVIHLSDHRLGRLRLNGSCSARRSGVGMGRS
jgi:hypothetical protein